MAKAHFTISQGNERIDRFLVGKYPEFSRAFIQKGISDGRVAVNQEVVHEKNFTVKSGDKITADFEAAVLVAHPELDIPIVYQDEEVLVVDKPAGIAVHPVPGQTKPTIAGWLVSHYPEARTVGEDPFRPGIVHRLDADTSGLLVIAKIQQAYQFFKSKFKSREVKKEYLALVHGKMQTKHGIFDQPIGRKSGEGKLRAGIGRDAYTEFWVKEEYQRGVDPAPDKDRRAVLSGEQSSNEIKIRAKKNTADNFYSSKHPDNPRRGHGVDPVEALRFGLYLPHDKFQKHEANRSDSDLSLKLKNSPRHHEASKSSIRVDTYTLVRVLLHTGRTHQIRVHFAQAGHPVAGDRLYGGQWRKSDQILFPRQFLHASRLSLTLPNGTTQSFSSPLPEDLQRSLDRLQTLNA